MSRGDAALRLQTKRAEQPPKKMHIAIDISQNGLSSSLQSDSGLTDVALRGSRQPDIVWSMTSELAELAECDPGMISDLFTLFLEDSAGRLQILSVACNAGDHRIVHAQAHSLKGSSLQIGAAGLGSLCAALELSNTPAPELRESMMRAINREFILVRQAIERYLVANGGLN
jgi:HPt (histidine-containing phosphotransfer) domain-containing protein